MPSKSWTVRFGEHELVFVNTWFHGCALFIDGLCVALSKQLLAVSRDIPVLTHRFVDRAGAQRTVEVYVVFWARARAEIVIDGRRVGGDPVRRLGGKTPRSAEPSALGAHTGASVAVPADLGSGVEDIAD